MGQFTNGVIVGVGISLLFAPKKGQEVRDLLVQSFQTFRGHPPENEALKQQVQQMAGRVQETQRMASRAAEMGGAVQNDLNNVAQQTGANVSSATTSGTATPNQSNQSNRPNQTRKSS